MYYYIQDATIIDQGLSFTGSLLIGNGLILQIHRYGAEAIVPSSIPDNLPESCTVIDARGLVLMNGFIDDQVHFRDPGQPQKGTIDQESRAAVLGGVTTFLDMPNNRPPVTSWQALDEKYALAAQKSNANYGFYMGATNENANHVLQPVRSCCGLKIFMGSSTGNMLVDQDEALEAFFSRFPTIVATHCEDESIIQWQWNQALSIYGKEHLSVSLHPIIRNRKACITSTQKAIDLACQYGTALHVLHLSTEEEVEMIQKAKKVNPKITAEVCVHHLWFTKEDYPLFGNQIKCNPAIKNESDRQALRQGVKEGIIQVIGSDHAPHTFEEKTQPYASAPSGIPLVQHSLLMLLQLVQEGVFSYEQVSEGISHGPARVFQIPKRGFIQEGYAADLVLIDPKTPITVSKENIAYTCRWSPFEGHTFPQSIAFVFVNGALTVDHGRWISRPPVYPVL